MNMKNTKQWTKRWKNWIRPTRLPGVFELKEGGMLIRARVTNPATGNLVEIKKVLPEADMAMAFQILTDEKTRVRAGGVAALQPKPRFSDYAVSVFERKVATREIKSERGRERWQYTLKHLIDGTEGVAGFGDYFVDRIQPSHVEAWKAGIATLITREMYKPTTANGWLYIFRHVMKRATREFQLPRNPVEGIDAFDTSEHETYTEEEPNALTHEEVREFLACMKEEFPAQYAMTFLGFMTGLRPSSMRPLRRQGATPDVLWDKRVILVRRSHTLGTAVMNTTKTGLRQRINVPEEVFEVLRWHLDTQLVTPEQKAAELLFPADDGGFRSECFLNKAFATVATLIGLKKNFTPRGMRRTFMDLTRAAKVEAIVTKSISGHLTDQMKDHYSTVSPVEQRESIGRVLRLVHPTGQNETTTGGGALGGAPSAVGGAPTRKVGS